MINKTFLSVDSVLRQAHAQYVQGRSNCFQLFGFDILIDNKLNPWLLEVNLSPSLACESLLDQQIKSQLITDLFNMVGIINHMYKRPQKKGLAHHQGNMDKLIDLRNLNKSNQIRNESRKRNEYESFSNYADMHHHMGRTSPAFMKSPPRSKKPSGAGGGPQKLPSKHGLADWQSQHKHMTAEQLFGLNRDYANGTPVHVQPHGNKKIEAMLQESEAEFRRRGKFKLIFPFRMASVSGSIFKALYDDRAFNG